MHDWLAVLKWLPFHLFASQLGLSSSMSKGRLLNAVFPVTLFPVEPRVIVKPPPMVLLLVVLAWISLLFEGPPGPPTTIPPSLSFAVLLTIVLLLLKARAMVSFTSFRTSSLSSPPNTKMPEELFPGSRTTFPSSFHWLSGPWIRKPKLKKGHWAVTVVNFTNELAEFRARPGCRRAED